jgi:hypothetical protein
LQQEIFTSVKVFLRIEASFVIPNFVIFLQPWTSNLVSLGQPREIEIKPESVKSAQFLIDNDSNLLQSAIPSGRASIPLQIP